MCSSAISTLQRGYPTVLRCDNGPELAYDAMADWAIGRVGLAFIPPCQPWRNGYVESFSARSATSASHQQLLIFGLYRGARSTPAQ